LGKSGRDWILEDPWNAPIEDLYTYTQDPDVLREPTEVIIKFDQGIPVAIDGVSYSADRNGQEDERIGRHHGVGRIDIVEDRLVGIKSREIYEAPAGIALIQAHEELENLTLERDVNRFKKGIEDKWATMVYEGLWFSDLKRSLDVFIDHTQKYVSGEIRLKLRGGRAVVTGRRSEQSLYDFNLATYDTGDSFDSSLAKGFIELWALPSKISARRSHGK
jgi:argininosuccinate synthase